MRAGAARPNAPRPRNRLAHLESKADLADLAATYAFGIARNHPFVDGNKRTALVVCRTFLRINGADIAGKPDEKYRAVRRLAEGGSPKRSWPAWI